jgi:hypothetical protein
MDEVSVFSSQQRELIREELVAAAKADPHIGGAAHLGSAALGQQDRWSDIARSLSDAATWDQIDVTLDDLHRQGKFSINYVQLFSSLSDERATCLPSIAAVPGTYRYKSHQEPWAELRVADPRDEVT